MGDDTVPLLQEINLWFWIVSFIFLSFFLVQTNLVEHYMVNMYLRFFWFYLVNIRIMHSECGRTRNGKTKEKLEH